MNRSIFQGHLVQLEVFDPDKDSENWARWNQNSELQQLLSSGPSTLWSANQIKGWNEKHANEMYSFTIYTRPDHQAIGSLDLSGINWVSRDSWVGIGIGEQSYWGKGYGSDAMNVLLRFAFETLNLNRVSLTVFEYNERAYHSYRKIGFQEEGRLRQWMQRAGRRYDLIFMGILRTEWEARALPPGSPQGEASTAAHKTKEQL
jgi:RimJ/RimL family protein N-acetyltransferase